MVVPTSTVQVQFAIVSRETDTILRWYTSCEQTHMFTTT